jgi:hypothetical protein
LHAQVRTRADARDDLEHLCRYIARPAIATERLSLARDGKVVYALRTPWRNGTTHFVFEPLTFIERLAALIPHAREHQLTYHGVLAAASSWRDWIVPGGQPDTGGAGAMAPAPCHELADSAESAASGLPANDPEPAQRVSAAARRTPVRYSWAELMMRVFDIDVLRCEHCGSRRKLIAMITEPFVVRRILRHLGLEHEPPVIAAARPPPQGTFGYC